jgi:quercetin dioxygenase-like cupin family protein
MLFVDNRNAHARKSRIHSENAVSVVTTASLMGSLGVSRFKRRQHLSPALARGARVQISWLKDLPHSQFDLGLGIALGAPGDRFLSAQQQSIKRTELLKTELEGVAGREGVMSIAELAPGAVAGKHFHPGLEFSYVLDGSLTLEPQGQAPNTFKTGEAFHSPAKIVHDAQNASTTAPVKVLVFLVGEKGQPLATPGPIDVMHLASSTHSGEYHQYPLPPLLDRHCCFPMSVP